MPNPSADAATRRIHINNLGPTMTEAQLRGLFLAYGAVISFSRPLDATTGRPGASAYIQMAQAEAETAAAALNGHQVRGEPLGVNVTNPVVDWAPALDRRPRSPSALRTVLGPSEQSQSGSPML